MPEDMMGQQMPEGLVDQAQQMPEEEPMEVEEGESNLTPEEDETYQAAMQMASEIIHVEDASSEQILKLLESMEPIMGVAEATLFVVDQIEQAFEGQVPETLVVPIADEVSDLIMELGESAGIFTLDETFFKRAKAAMMKLLFDAYGVDETDMEGMLQGVTADEVKNMQGMFEGGPQ